MKAAMQHVCKLFFIIDDGVLDNHPNLQTDIRDYFAAQNQMQIAGIAVVKGGEQIKNDRGAFQYLLELVEKYGIDRHSYIIAIGGGAVLDIAGFVAAIAHRGVRHIRIPTTVLSQNDSGVGVKNGINYFEKKNFLGTFAPPAAVINDIAFLSTLPDLHWRSGISEAIKVALIKDADFFYWLEANATAILSRDMQAMQYQIKHCAQLHLQHICSHDPFEFGSSRPLDFGHWSAHKMEQLSGFDITHGEAVASGIALDAAYSRLMGWLPETEYLRVISLMQKLGFNITHPLMMITSASSPLIAGLDEFREHLGGRLTLMMLDAIGKGREVNEIDTEVLQMASALLQKTVPEYAY